MGIQKKNGKGRLDKWYKLAKEKGYRARAAFKLIQLNKKYGFLERSKVLLDLCAAPGSWSQVAAESMPVGSLIVGVDLSPIKAIPKVITFQGDITTDKCKATIRSYFKTWKADTVLHDGAPNVGTAWVQDSFNQAELVLQAMKLATEFLLEGGTFVTKVFRSKDYNSLLWVFNQLFDKVESTKPPSSRNVSAEIFVVCRGYKSPKRIDPKFLDPRSVFAELSDPTPNNEAKVYNPEVKKRKRDGYEEGNYTQYKEALASEFIKTTDPIAMLGSFSRLSFEQPKSDDITLAVMNKLPETTTEIRNCCLDLRVLGRKEFRNLLKWRLKVREKFGLVSTKSRETPQEETITIEPMDEELKIQEQLQNLSQKESARRKRERRRENEKKQKEIVRMQLNMTAPMDIGLEQSGPVNEGSIFSLKPLSESGEINKISKGKMALITKKDMDQDLMRRNRSDDEMEESDFEEDRLDRELDRAYEQYQKRKSETNAKYLAKKAREQHDDGEWEGFSCIDSSSNDDDDEFLEELSSQEEEEEEEEERDWNEEKSMIVDLNDKNHNIKSGLSSKAAQFFSQDIFKDISGATEACIDFQTDDGDDVGTFLINPSKINKTQISAQENTKNEITYQSDLFNSHSTGSESSDEENDEDLEIVKKDTPEMMEWEEEEPTRAKKKQDIDIITAEAMTLAHQIVTGKKTKHDLIDDSWNKHAFRQHDSNGLPDWFLDDERRHDKPLKPISSAAANAIKQKLRALNARPIKKVREAKDRKKFKAAQRLEKLRKKSALLQDDETMTEREKSQTISRLINKAAKKKSRPKVKIVVARGGNRGIAGRPKGVKGKYKIVDARLKKDTRAKKRIAKKK